MYTKFSVLTLVLLLFCCFLVEGQYRRGIPNIEVHGGLGAINVFGDLGGTKSTNDWMGIKDLQIASTRPTLYVGGRLYFNDYFAGKANLFAGMAAGNDKNSKNEGREYTYTALMIELSVQGELHFWRWNKSLGTLIARKHGRLGSKMFTSAYVFAGFGFVGSFPSVDTHGKDLASGERTKSAAAALAFPLGVGIRTDLNASWGIGLEFGGRFTTSDYIDGFTTDWSKKNDVYYCTTLHAIYRFGGGLPKSGSRK